MYGKGFSIWPGSFVHARCSSMLQTILYLKYSAAIDTVFCFGCALKLQKSSVKAFRIKAEKIGGNLQL